MHLSVVSFPSEELAAYTRQGFSALKKEQAASPVVDSVAGPASTARQRHQSIRPRGLHERHHHTDDGRASLEDWPPRYR
ncbi:hypothetical protein GCM10010313_27150 [Streptomyces violarus]|nr:hypothetical protein GCM10010313_27150 [Streptomyces violarus]